MTSESLKLLYLALAYEHVHEAGIKWNAQDLALWSRDVKPMRYGAIKNNAAALRDGGYLELYINGKLITPESVPLLSLEPRFTVAPDHPNEVHDEDRFCLTELGMLWATGSRVGKRRLELWPTDDQARRHPAFEDVSPYLSK